MKPVAELLGLVDVVWFLPETPDAARRSLEIVTELTARHPVRALCVERVLAAPVVGGDPAPVGGSGRMWTVPAREPSSRAAVRTVVGAAWTVGLRRPVVVVDPVTITPLPELAGWPRARWAPFDSAQPAEDAYDAVRAASAAAPPPLRVVYLDHCALASGAELALARMAPAFRGVEPSVTLAEDGPLVALLQRSEVPVRVEPMNPRARSLKKGAVVPGLGALRAAFATAGYALRLARAIRRERPDLVATNSLKAALYGGVAARLAGVPVVWHLRDRIAEDYLPSPAVRMVRAAARVLPTGVVANSEATLTTLALSPACRRRLLAQAIGSPCVPPAAGAVPARSSAFTVGMVGRLAPWKGQDVFLRAFARAFPTGDAHAVVIGAALFGEDDYAAELSELADELGIVPRVEFTGHVDDVGAELRRLDVAVHASVTPEPFGQVVVEAMLSGVPVVASDAGGPAEIVTDGVDGLLAPVGDVGALAERLRRLAGDDASGPDWARRRRRAPAGSRPTWSPTTLRPPIA